MGANGDPKVPTEDLMRALLTPEKFAEWEKQEASRREFWRTLQGPAQRPIGSNADEWNLFISENKDACSFLAVNVAEAIEEAEQRSIVRLKKQIDGYGIALMGIAVGCSGHRELAHKALAEWNPRAAADVDTQNRKEAEARKAAWSDWIGEKK